MWKCVCGQENYLILGRCAGCSAPNTTRPPYPIIKTDLPCLDCDKEIQPEQSYLPTDDGPLHFSCGGRRRRASMDLRAVDWPF